MHLNLGIYQRICRFGGGGCPDGKCPRVKYMKMGIWRDGYSIFMVGLGHEFKS